MLDIYELEQKQKALKKKRLKAPILIAFLLFLSVGIFAYTYLSSSKDEPKVPIVKKEEVATKVQEAIEPTPKEDEPIAQKHTAKPIAPSIDFLDSYKEPQNEPIKNQPIKENTIVQKPEIVEPIEEIFLEKTLEESPKVQSEPTTEVVLKDEPKEPMQISISKKDSKDELDSVIKRFENNKNPALSLFIARKYYTLGEYKKAYDYALITNNLDSKIEDSWIIFAKSLFKLGQKDDAIATLKEYVSFSKSQAASMLLKDIQSGKFK